MNEIEKIKIWEHLKTEIGKIYDQNTRSLYYRAFLARCIDEWGFNPENPASGQKKTFIADDWEKDFIEDIKDSVSYDVDVREEKRQETLDETKKNIKNMLRKGYTFSDIPEEIQTPYIRKLYLDELFSIGKELAQCADDLMEN